MISGRSRLSAQAGGVVYCMGVERNGGDCAAVKSECEERLKPAGVSIHTRTDTFGERAVNRSLYSIAVSPTKQHSRSVLVAAV